MTSISQQQVQPPQAPSYASVSKKPFAPSSGIVNSQGAAGGVAQNQNGKPDNAPVVNGRNPIIPAVPTVDSPAVNGANVGSGSAVGAGDHSRKSSVTISASGASGYMPNGGPVGKPTGSNGIQFGNFNADGSPAIPNAVPHTSQPTNSLAVNAPNPRITSPMSSPSPIPQPAASGGRPPSAFQGQGNNVNFGTINGEDPNRQLRPGALPQGLPPSGPQSSHLRRESSQSTHSDFSNQAMGPGQGRGGYPSQGGRGRGSYGAAYNQQMPYSPNPNLNNSRPNPNQFRAGQNMTPGYQQQGQRLTPYPPSPHLGNRSPALPNAQPVHHQQGPVPMGSPLYPQPYGGYPPNMPQVNPQSSLPVHLNHRTPELRRAQLSLPGGPRKLSTPDFSPQSGQFEQFLTSINQGAYGVQQSFVDPSMYAYYQQQFNMAQGLHMAPSSPRPQQQPQQQYFPGQYGNPQQPQPMSRTPSAMSATDRPGSAVGRPQAPSTTPSVSQAPAPSRPSNSPATKPPSFQKPQRKGGLVIKDPTTGAVMDFAKQVVSPPPKSSPANVSSTPTPPLPRAGSQPDVQHHRAESKSIKTDEEKRNDMKDAIAKKMEADKAEEKRKLEEEEAKATETKKAAEAQLLKQKEEADAKQQEAAKAQIEAENAQREARAEAEAAENAVAKAKEEAEEKARKEKEEEEEFVRIEAEMERQEREAEERHQKKMQAKKAEQARKAEEAARMEEENMKKAEREAEEAEEARIKKLEDGESEESRQERSNLFAALKKEAPGTPTSEDVPAAETPEDSGAVTPASEVPMAPPAKVAGTKPKPVPLQLKTSKEVESPQRTAQLTSLLSARRLLNINDVSYPSGFVSPNPSLNTNAPPGKFNYDSKFLLQFRGVFVEKPTDDWETEIKSIMGDAAEPASARSASARGNNPVMGLPNSRQASVNRAAPMERMGVFGQSGRTLPPGTTSQDRFKQSTHALQAPSGQRPMQNPLASMFAGNHPGGFPIASTKSMERNPSSTGMGGHPNSPRGNLSQRGGSTRGSKAGKARESEKDAKNMPITSGQNIKPIEVSATGWKPLSVGQGATGLAGPAPGGDGHMAPDVVQRKVKSNLNKMTPNNFMRISDQILLIAGQSKDETDGRTLRQVIQLTFEKATDEAHWAQMYAEFCKRMLESMSPEIKDEGILDKNGQVVVGGALFRKYLLNRCQTEFERGWKIDIPAKPEGESEEAAMLSDEYYIAAAAKRRGLGLVRFIGELYKLSMLTERIMHQCVHKLVDYEGVPDEAEVESLTSLLKTIGQNLDSNERGVAMMDAYFTRITTMINAEGLPSRLRFMLMDIVDLRKDRWRTKDGAIKGPTTLEAVRAQAVAQEQEKEQERMREAASRRGGGGGGRPPLGRGDARNFSGGGMMPPPDFKQSTVGLDDIKRLQNRGTSRQASSQQAPTFGPSSMFASARGSNTRKPLFGKPGEDSSASSRTGTPPAQKEKKDKEDKETSKNAFSALASLDSGEPADSASPAASPPTSKLQPAERQRSKSPLGKQTPEGETTTS